MGSETTVKCRPIIFSAPMVRAIIAGKKTQTRRVVKPQPDWSPYSPVRKLVAEKMGIIGWWKSGGVTAEDLLPYCPYGQPGDRLWVKEAFQVNGNGSISYAASDDGSVYRAWKSSRYMPRSASRIALEITGVRVERVQDISESDAIAEGLLSEMGDGGGPGPGYKWKGIGYHGAGFDHWKQPMFHVPGHDGRCACKVAGPTPAQCAFREIWDSINGTRPGCAWTDNPFVWAVSFRRVEDGN